MGRMRLDGHVPVPDAQLPLHTMRQSPRADSSPVMGLVDDFIARHIDHPITLADLAAGCGYNADYLYRVIRKKTGMSAIRYISTARYEQAARLIQNTDQTLSEISYSLGFENLQYFSRFFKRHSGITPSEYLSSFRKTTRTDYV